MPRVTSSRACLRGGVDTSLLTFYAAARIVSAVKGCVALIVFEAARKTKPDSLTSQGLPGINIAKV